MTDRELDALVAEKVTGWKKITCLTGGNQPHGEPDDDYNRDWPMNPHREPIPEYSTDLAAAWGVVGRIGGEFYLRRTASGHYEAIFYPTPGGVNRYCTAETTPRAICLAALRAVGVEVSAIVPAPGCEQCPPSAPAGF